jgi:hypothetical protein
MPAAAVAFAAAHDFDAEKMRDAVDGALGRGSRAEREREALRRTADAARRGAAAARRARGEVAGNAVGAPLPPAVASEAAAPQQPAKRGWF